MVPLVHSEADKARRRRLAYGLGESRRTREQCEGGERSKCRDHYRVTESGENALRFVAPSVAQGQFLFVV
jgi:hypothetical protein